jgi:SAM-dependent methyltransferase
MIKVKRKYLINPEIIEFLKILKFVKRRIIFIMGLSLSVNFSILILTSLIITGIFLNSESVYAQAPTPTPDIHYIPTAPEIVDRMLELARIKKNDVLYDLGCGDGRIVIAAAKKYGIHAFGYDIDPVRILEARANAVRAGVEHLVTFEEKDIFTLDLSKASVVTLYLLPRLNVQLMGQLAKLKKGSRIISHDFDMRGRAIPTHTETIRPSGDDRDHSVFLWEIPWKMKK